MDAMVGQQLGPYRIDRQLGAGGMGVVYGAWDARLERPVAIKLLTAAGPDESARIAREARVASALNHPSICTVHDVGESGGRSYIVMELVEGRPLSDAIPHGGLPADLLIRYAREIAEALAHAHERGVVHGDLKTTNIVLTPEGRLKLLDFGLARRQAVPGADATLSAATSSGIAAGTLACMAPELLRGEAAAARSDVWAFGIVLYEMSAGRQPFAAATALDLVSQILRDPPAPVPEHVPAELRSVVQRCLAKEPRQRYARAGEIAAVLEALGGNPTAGATRTARAVAVLPFRDLAGAAGDPQLGLALADATITELSLVRSLLVRPTAAILRYHDGAADPLAAGRELGVDAVAAGNFQRAPGRLRVTVQLIDVSNGRVLWGVKLDTSFDDVFRMQDEISREIARALEVELSPGDERRMAQAAPTVSPAHEQYLKGRVLLLNERLDSVNAAIECFERAIELDPRLPQAHAGLADAYVRLAFTFAPEGDWYRRARERCDHALSLDPQLPEGRYLRGRLMWSPDGGFDHATAIREFLQATASRPNLNEGHHWLGIVLLHVSLIEAALQRFDRALAIMPEDVMAELHRAFCRYLTGDFEMSLQMTERLLATAPSYWASYQGALALIQLGRVREAERLVEQAARTYAGDVLAYTIRGLIAALAGDVARAREQIDLTIANRKAFGHYHHAQHDIACIFAQLGQLDDAIAWLEAAARNGFPCVSFFEKDRLLAPARAHPRFAPLMAELYEECRGYGDLYHRMAASTAG